MTKFSVDREMRRARASERQGAFDEAKRIYEAILERFPNNARARQALTALSKGGQSPSARAALPDEAENHLRQGIALGQQGRIDEAIASFRLAARLRPGAMEPHMMAGLLLKDEGRYGEAIDSFRDALRIKPDSFDALCGCGIALMHQNKLDEACRNFAHALKIKPNSFDVHLVHGYALKQLGRFGEAIASFRQALQIRPDSAETLRNLGLTLRALGKLDEALNCFGRALKAEPGNGVTLTDKLWLQLMMSDWQAFEEFAKVSTKLGVEGDAVPPFQLLPLEDSPERQAARARTYALKEFGATTSSLPVPRKPRPGRTRVGYFSADFRQHPMLYLMAGHFREHDKSRFETFAYSFGPPDQSELRQRVARDVDHFIDVSDMSDSAIVDLARQHGLDIAIDLMGYTQHSRPQLFARRLAPVQINFLGFPGTMGAEFMDYIIADPIVIPEAERAHYSEKILYLPKTYWPTDNQQQIADEQTSRRDFGLPEDELVFCCFNQSSKIGPREFDIWMRLLNRVEGSVLWLLPSNQWAEANLRREAQERDVDPDRLIFAERLPNPRHLARHRHADLFLDTFNYNAHTTASDALWAGLPVVTMAGRQFAARVCASLLTAISLPELITENAADYEALILDLATNPGRLAAIKAKLAQNRLTQPLFDTPGYTRDFEKALEAAHNQSVDGVA